MHSGVSVLLLAFLAVKTLSSTDFYEDGITETTPPNCPNCVFTKDLAQRNQLDSLRLETIKRQLLSKLGLRSKPNVTINIPREVILESLHHSKGAKMLLEDYQPVFRHKNQRESRGEENEEEYYAKTSEIISFAEPGPRLNNHTLLEFHQNSEDFGSLIVSRAYLWIFIRRLSRDSFYNVSRSRPPTTLWVFRLPTKTSSANENFGKLVCSLKIQPTDVGWKRLDVTEAVEWWFARPGEFLKLLVDCSSCGKNVKAELFTAIKRKGAKKPHSRQYESTHRPFLVIETSPKPTRRLARRALQCDKHTKMCCKQNLFVSFKELGWDDWIIAPSGYQANYCKGSCSSLYRTLDSFTSFYSHVHEELRRNYMSETMLQCCAPSRLSAMTLIYVDAASNIVMRKVPKMVVDECGCA